MTRAGKSGLREGFSTGTAATAAAMAALMLLHTGKAPRRVETPLPPFAAAGGPTPPLPRAWRAVPLESCGAGPAPEVAPADFAPWGRAARVCHATVRKDGGDDPDVTSGALISASMAVREAAPLPPWHPEFAAIDGGRGVGRVSLPGLPVPPGEAAINPGPREQLRLSLWLTLRRLGVRGPYPPLAVIISVPEGEALARRTLNPRLGILGGISILGTHGTVRPYSNDAWRATIAEALDVAKASGCARVCLSTGRRSESLLMARHPELPKQAFIQAADFAGFALGLAGALPFKAIAWGCFFGKLVKLAQGEAHTHARAAALDMAALARLCADAGCGRWPEIANCVTAARALDIILADRHSRDILRQVALRAADTLAGLAGRPVELHLFHPDGRELVRL